MDKKFNIEVRIGEIRFVPWLTSANWPPKKKLERQALGQIKESWYSLRLDNYADSIAESSGELNIFFEKIEFVVNQVFTSLLPEWRVESLSAEVSITEDFGLFAEFFGNDEARGLRAIVKKDARGPVKVNCGASFHAYPLDAYPAGVVPRVRF